MLLRWVRGVAEAVPLRRLLAWRVVAVVGWVAIAWALLPVSVQDRLLIAVSPALGERWGGPVVPFWIYETQYLSGAAAGLLLGARRHISAVVMGALSLAIAEGISMTDGGWAWHGATLSAWLWDLVSWAAGTLLLMLPGYAVYQGWPRRPTRNRAKENHP